MRPPKAAVIYLGSSAIYLKIAEKQSEKVGIIEEVEYPLNLGHDTFTTNKISFDKVNELCEILSRFLRLIKDYQVETVRTVATTAIREADNRAYILDQIKVKTGLEVEVFDDTEEKKYIYQGVYRRLENNSYFSAEEALISYIGTGRLGVAVYSQGRLESSQNIRIGSLKLSEILGDIQEKTDKFYLVVEEYLSSFSFMLQSFLPTNRIDHFVTSGKEIEMISKLCAAEEKQGTSYISKTKFKQLYEEIKDKTPKQVMKAYDLREEKAEILLPSMTLYKTIFEFTTADEIVVPFASLVDILLFKILFSQKAQTIEQFFAESTILSAKNVGKKYDYDQQHAAKVEQFAVKIFDEMKHIHGLEKRERLLLRVAAILHDAGKFISLKRHYYHSYDLIRASNILGLNNRETEIVAGLARYHSRKVPRKGGKSYERLSQSDLVLMSKLASILRLAEALDRAHKQKFTTLDVEINKNELEITVATSEITLLEEWTFNQKSDLFEEVFGIKTKLKKKGI